MRGTCRAGVLVAAAGLVLAGCVAQAPPSISCPGLVVPHDELAMPARAMAVAARGVDPQVRNLAARLVASVPRLGARLDRAGAVREIDVLGLSTGGQWGAFGTGFLEGWQQGGLRPPFQWVSGVSAGGVMAPFVFAGGRHEVALREIYNGLSADEVYRARRLAPLTLPASVLDTAPFRARLREAVDPAFLGELAGQADTRRLLIGAANLNTGRFDVFDLTAFAAQRLPVEQQRDCVTDAILATSAIPGAFPPSHINDAFYVDGGARRHVFFEAVKLAQQALRADGLDTRINAWIIINGDVQVRRNDRLDYWLLPVALRSFAIVVDEGVRQSVREAVRFGAENGWTVRGIAAPRNLAPVCEGDDIDDDDIFSDCMTRYLYELGRRTGSERPIGWLDGPALLDRVNNYEN